MICWPNDFGQDTKPIGLHEFVFVAYRKIKNYDHIVLCSYSIKIVLLPVTILWSGREITMLCI